MPFAPDQQTTYKTLDIALHRLVCDHDTDPLQQIIALVDTLRCADKAQALLRWRYMNAQLAASQDLRYALRHTLLRLFAEKHQMVFYTEAGLLPNTGFFSELNRKIRHKLLPELLDKNDMRDCISLIFSHTDDNAWLDSLPLAERGAFWELLGLHAGEDAALINDIIEQLLNAALILSHRISAMGLEPELLRVHPRLRDQESPFIAMNMEMIAFVESFRRSILSEAPADDGAHLLVLLDQCRDVVQRARLSSAKVGTSMSLSFLLVRLSQHITRLLLLVHVMTVRFHPDAPHELLRSWADFLREALVGERQRNSISQHFSNILSLLALRVTDNAARTGEHYIARNRAEWWGILRAAAGAGALIAVIGLLKILSYSLNLGIVKQSIMNSAIYAGGFLLIYRLHWVIATKQPAMTAATLANSISQSSGRLREVEKIADLVTATFRSQMAAIAGNVMVALPLAALIGAAFTLNNGAELLSTEKAYKLLADLDPLHSLVLLHAAIAGVWLFLAGLVSGYLDNEAVYRQTGERIAQLPSLCRLLGNARAAQLGAYLARNAGGLGGNIFFGCMLGLTPLLGFMLDLPIDVRHVALSSANVGYALTALDFSVDQHLVIITTVGLLLVGLVNLGVSFLLALWVAMRARKVSFWRVAAVLPVLAKRLIPKPVQ